MNRHFLTMLVALSVTGCAQTSNKSPSLLPRVIESKGKAMIEEPAVEQVALTASDPQRLANVQASLERAQNTLQPFRTAVSSARALTNAASGSGKGSEAWVQAIMAIGRAEAAHGPTVKALGELDEHLQKVVFGMRSADEAAILGAVMQVEGIGRAQQAEIQALYQQLGI